MLARYFLFQSGPTWTVALEGRVVGRYASRTEATEAAIVMADLMGAMHHDSDVMMLDKGALELIWTFGQDAIGGRGRMGRSRPAGRHLVQVQQAARPT